MADFHRSLDRALAKGRSVNDRIELTEAESYYREHGWSGCAGSAWDRLSPATQDGWRAAADERAKAERQVAAVRELVPVVRFTEEPPRTEYLLRSAVIAALDSEAPARHDARAGGEGQ